MFERNALDTRRKTSRILDILNKIPVYLLMLFLFFVLAASFFWRAEFCGYRYGDRPVWNPENPFRAAISIIGMILFLLAVYFAGEKFRKLNRRIVISSIIGLSMISQAAFVLLFPAKQFADQGMVNQIALDILSGNYAHFQNKGYLFQFPNNIGVTLLLAAMYRLLPKSMLVPKLINVVFTAFTTYFIFRIYEETAALKSRKGNAPEGYGLLLLAGFFLPAIMLNNLIYNDIPATTFFAGVAFCAVKHVKTKKPFYLIVSGILVVAGNFLRQVGLLLLIAVTIYYLIKKVNVFKSLAFFVVFLVLCQAPLALVNAWLLRANKITEPVGANSVPIHMWLNIGMNEKKIGYWDDGFSYNIYLKEGGYNREKSMVIYNRLISDYLVKKGLISLANVYIKKNAWLWTEGTYQAEYYGIGSWGYLYNTFATKLFDGNVLLRDLARQLLHVSNLAVLALSLAGLVWSVSKKKAYPLVLPVIVLLGFIAFYTLWEIKPRYIYPAYPYLLLTAYHGTRILCGETGLGKLPTANE